MIKDYDTKHDFILIPNEFKDTIETIIQKKFSFCPLDFFKQKAYEIEFNNIFFTIYNEINESDDIESRNFINLFKSMTSSFDIVIEQNKLKITINTHTNINFKIPTKDNKTKKYTPQQIKQFLKDKKILKEISEKMKAKFNIPVQITIK